MNNLTMILIFLVVGFSLLLFIISAISALKVRSTKTAFLSAAFAFFLLKEIYTLYLVLFTYVSNQSFLVATSVLDLIVLFFFYAAVLK